MKGDNYEVIHWTKAKLDEYHVMEAFKRCFSLSKPAVIAMIHVPALPGTPKNVLPFKEIVKTARHEAEILRSCGVDAVMVENMHDVPYMIGDKNGPEITACMTALCREVKAVFDGPVGVQILAGANKQAIAVALAADLQFVRAECFVFSHVADEGLMHGCAGDLLRYRRQIGAENILVLTDIKKKHSSHAITADVSIGETASAAELFLSDGVIVTGSCTGKQADPSELIGVRDYTTLPVLVGSGVTVDNITQYLTADAVIVGSHFKKNGLWSNAIVPEKVSCFMSALNRLKPTVDGRNGSKKHAK